MKPTAWQRLRSHLWPVPVRRVRSERHPRIWLRLVRGRYQLSTPHAIYSFGDLYVNFAETFRRLDLQRLPGRRVLVLGLGLGSVIELLEHQHQFRGEYVAVEIDETIVELARTFTLSELSAPVRVITADAEKFLREQGGTGAGFDLILLDIFCDTHIPAFFSSPECAASTAGLLRPGGLIVENRLYRTPKDKEETDHYFEQVFLPLHPRAVRLDVDGNRMLIQDGAYLRSV